MNIRKAEERDISRITEIYAHARAFMAENGNATQWSGGYPGEDVIRADIAAGTLHVCEREGKVAAVFAFILGGDPCYAVIDGAWHAARPYGTIHRIASDENPVMAFDTADLDAHDGIFALPREEWEESPEFDKLVKDRMDHQEEREQAFLSHKGDCFAIYQVKHTDELRDIRYEGLEWLQSIGRTVQRDNYELVYTAPLLSSDLKGDTTEQLFYRFNNEHPTDYGHPSMSVSDIVAIKQDGKVSCHYCDSFGFQQIPGFLPDNPLKSAEMTVEDDYGMIDGVINNGPKEPTVAQLEQQARSGQPISLMDLAAAAHREDRDKKKSVMEQLKSQPKSEHKKTAPKKSAEREI